MVRYCKYWRSSIKIYRGICDPPRRFSLHMNSCVGCPDPKSCHRGLKTGHEYFRGPIFLLWLWSPIILYQLGYISILDNSKSTEMSISYR